MVIKYSRVFFLSVLLFVAGVCANAAGVPDLGFGNNGTVVTTNSDFTVAVKVTLQTDGKIVALGNVGSSANLVNIVVARYLSNGSPDPSFGTNGYAIHSFGTQSETANDLILQPDGKIIIAGRAFSPTTQSVDFLIARLNPDGSRDTSFGTDGFTTVNQSSIDFFNAAAVAPDGKIVAVGGTSQNGGEAAIVRFLANGSLDGGFAQQGLKFVNYPNLTNDNYRTVTILPDVPPVGRILVGGEGLASVPHLFIQNFITSRYYADGSECQGFGVECVVTVGSGGVQPKLDVHVQPDGRILTISDTARRFLGNGEPDPTFAGSGAGSQLALLPEGRFVVAGNFLSNNATWLYSAKGVRIGRALDLPADDVVAQPDGKIITITANGDSFVIRRFNAFSSLRNALADFDDDDKSDLSVYSGSTSTVGILGSRSGTTSGYAFGEPSSVPLKVVPAKIAGLPFAVGYWKSSSQINSQGLFCSAQFGEINRICQPWGLRDDVPLTGDFDGDGLNDPAVFRPSDGVWYILYSASNQLGAFRWGINGDKPVPADYDYDGITDLAIYRPASGTWWIHRSGDDSYFTIPFGIASDIPLTGDFDGDGRADFTVYRASEGNWYQYLTTEGYRVVRFGLPADFPVPGDYDGDGRHDIAVFREGVWYILQSSEGLRITIFGDAGVVPVTVRYDQ